MTMGSWHGPWVCKICKKRGKRGVVCTFVTKRYASKVPFVPGFCVEAQRHWPHWGISNLPNASCAADVFFHKCLLVVGVCQQTKFRRQLLWSIETEHEGKAIIMTVMTVMMMMMMMMMTCTYCSYHGLLCRSTMMMVMMTACTLVMLTVMVAKWTSLPSPPPPHPNKKKRKALKPQKPAKTLWIIQACAS